MIVAAHEHLAARDDRGFALIISLGLMAFTVLLLIMVSSSIAVEGKGLNQETSVLAARQDAILGLSIATGQLQKFAGPDQRVTTTADITADTDKEGRITPDPVFPLESPRLSVEAGSRYWTGVWGNNQTEIGYNLDPDEIPPTSGNRRGVTPALLGWLVSGNDSTDFGGRGTSGGVTPGSGLTYTPDSPIDLSNLAEPTIDGDDAVLLVGPGSVGSGGNATEEYVVAPLVDIGDVGRYAWWVGDEGVKARVNLQNGYQQSGDVDDQFHSFVTAQRSAVEFMDLDPAGTANPARIGNDYDFTAIGIPKILSDAQFPLIGDSADAQSRLSEASQNRFHDLTPHSFGVLADPYAGGLKKDLTADIADISSDFSYRPDDDDPIFTPLSSSADLLPTWGILRNWVRTNPSAPGQAIDPIAPGETHGGLYPTIAYFSMGYNYFLEGSRFKMAFYPIISLHNPYPVPIAATDYDLGLRFSEQAKYFVQLEEYLYDEAGNPIMEGGSHKTGYVDKIDIDLNQVTFVEAGAAISAPSSFIRMQIKGVEIPPGQRMLFVLPDSEHNSEYNRVAPPQLERAPDSEFGLGESNYFVMSGLDLDFTRVVEFPRIRLAVDIGSPGGNNIRYTEVSLALAEGGSLSDFDLDPENPDIYQQVLNVFPQIATHVIRFSGSAESVNGEGYFCTTTGGGDLVSAKQIPPSFANSAFRLATGYEGNSWWSSHWKMGFVHPYYPSRVIADGTLRAPHIMATSLENTDRRPDGNNRGIGHSIAAGIFGSKFADATQDQGRDPHPGVDYYRYTTGVDGGPDTGSSPNYSVLWDVLDSPDRFLSLGQLQHAPFSFYDFEPSYLFGNSYAQKRIPRNSNYNPGILRGLSDAARDPATKPLYDTSWLLNRSLWDRYFVSGVPSDWSQADIDSREPLPNARMTYFERDDAGTDLETIQYSGGSNAAYDQAAANLLVAGSFNINSTSEQAWRAVFGGSYGVPLNPEYANSGDEVETAIPYPRFTHNLAQGGDSVYPSHLTTMKPDPALSGSGDSQFETKFRNTLHLGNRGLFLNEPSSIVENPSPESVVAELARTMVQEIRRRGPFLSLADFINRPMTEPSFSVPSNPSGGTPDEQKIAGIKGALQAAIDRMDPNVAQVNPGTFRQATSGLKIGRAWPYYDWDSEHAVGGPIGYGTDEEEIYRVPFAMAPKFLSQADILSSLGPSLSARSDTFTIRSYGEQINPTTEDVEARGWCEAVVQRTPEYVGGEASHADPASLPAGSLSRQFGRAFEVVSVRWLDSNEI